MISLLLPLLATGIATAKATVINDGQIISSFQKGVGAMAESEDSTSAEDLVAQAKKAPNKLPGLKLPVDSTANPADAVYLIGSVFKCGKCDKWHPGGVATAWALTSDGLMVSNFHVFQKAKGPAMGVCDREGNTFPITEVIAVDKPGDIAIFRVDAENLKTLALGPAAEVGETIRVISHPNRRFFMQTSGEVGRYHAKRTRPNGKPVTWMSITADFAKGSSGGPVIDDDGRVVGMVASTQSIYYESDDGTPKGPLQMVIKNCVPVTSIRALIPSE